MGSTPSTPAGSAPPPASPDDDQPTTGAPAPTATGEPGSTGPGTGAPPPDQTQDELKHLPNSVSTYTGGSDPSFDPSAAAGSTTDKFVLVNGHWHYNADQAELQDPVMADEIGTMNSELARMPTSSEAGPGGGGPGSGITVAPEDLHTFAQKVQLLWDDLLGPQGLVSTSKTADATDPYSTAPTPFGFFGQPGQEQGLNDAHDEFQATALQLLNEIALVMGDIPSRMGQTVQAYTAADQANAVTFTGVVGYLPPSLAYLPPVP